MELQINKKLLSPSFNTKISLLVCFPKVQTLKRNSRFYLILNPSYYDYFSQPKDEFTVNIYVKNLLVKVMNGGKWLGLLNIDRLYNLPLTFPSLSCVSYTSCFFFFWKSVLLDNLVWNQQHYFYPLLTELEHFERLWVL